MGGTTRSPLCPQAALTVTELVAMPRGTVLMLFWYENNGRGLRVRSMSRARHAGLVGIRSSLKLGLDEMDLGVSPGQFSMVSIGATPDPSPSPNTPGLYYPGTGWSLRILVRPQDVGAPPPHIYAHL
jgi:hypothetical protein